MRTVLQVVHPDTWSTTNVAKFTEAEIAARAQAAQRKKEWFWSAQCPNRILWNRWQDRGNSAVDREKAYASLVKECSVHLNKLGARGIPIFAKLGYFRC